MLLLKTARDGPGITGDEAVVARSASQRGSSGASVTVNCGRSVQFVGVADLLTARVRCDGDDGCPANATSERLVVDKLLEAVGARHNVPDGGRIVGFCNQVIQAYQIDVEVVAKMLSENTSVK